MGNFFLFPFDITCRVGIYDERCNWCSGGEFLFCSALFFLKDCSALHCGCVLCFFQLNKLFFFFSYLLKAWNCNALILDYWIQMLLHSVSDTDTPPIRIRTALNMLASSGCRKQVLDTEFQNSNSAVQNKWNLNSGITTSLCSLDVWSVGISLLDKGKPASATTPWSCSQT